MHVSGAVVVGDDARAYGRWADPVLPAALAPARTMRDARGMRTMSVLAALLGSVAVFVACSSSDPEKPAVVNDAGAEGGSSSSSSSSSSGGGGDAAVDAPQGPQVKELAPPACHDVVQRGPEVTPTVGATAPAPNPLTALVPGVYVEKERIDYEVATPGLPDKEQATAIVTANRYYYLYQGGSDRTAVVTDWVLAGGKLTRKILCTSAPGGSTGATSEVRVDASPNGYTVYTTGSTGKPVAIRYERVE